MTIPVNRVRVWKPKSRAGCRTCKQRRVKCDETRPLCCRCQRSGFNCAGYDHGVARSAGAPPPFISPRPRSPESTPQLAISVPMLMFSLTDQERSAVEFFQLRTIAILPGNAWGVSWDCIIFQIVLTYNEPGLMHALAALGAIHRADTMSPEDSVGSVYEQQRLALLQSNKAMQHISHYIRTKGNHNTERRVEIILLAALLFFSFEILHGQYARAGLHLTTAQRILAERNKHNTDSRYQYLNPDEQATQLITIKSKQRGTIDMLAQSFLRLARDPVVNVFKGTPLVPVCREPIPPYFSSLEEVLVHFDCLEARCHSVSRELIFFACRAIANGEGPDVSTISEWATEMLETTWARVVPLDAHPALMADLTALRRDVSAWISALDLCSFDTSRSMPYLLARLESLYLHIRVEACRDASEMLIDRFQACFEEILVLGEQVLELSSRSAAAANIPKLGNRLSFAVGTRLLQVLAFLACRCRKSALRKRGLELIRMTVLRGLLNNEQLADCLEFVVDMEEQIARATFCMSAKPELEAIDIPEHARMVNISVYPVPHASRKGREVAKILWVTGRFDTASSLKVREYALEDKSEALFA